MITEETQTENNSLDHQESEKVRELTEKQEKLTQCLKDAKQQLFRTIEVHDQDKEEALQRFTWLLNHFIAKLGIIAHYLYPTLKKNHKLLKRKYQIEFINMFS